MCSTYWNKYSPQWWWKRSIFTLLPGDLDSIHHFSLPLWWMIVDCCIKSNISLKFELPLLWDFEKNTLKRTLWFDTDSSNLYQPINKYRKVSKLLKDELVTIAVQMMQKTLAAPFWSCLWLTSGYPNLHGMIAMLLNNQFSEKRKKTLRYIINIHYQYINLISTSIIQSSTL